VSAKSVEKPGPPKGVAPALLFRRLTERHPRQPLPWSFKTFSHKPLSVIGLTNREAQRAFDAEHPIYQLIRISTVIEGTRRPLFESADDILDMPAVEVDVFRLAWWQVYCGISPIYGQVDLDAWWKALMLGAEDVSNVRFAHRLGEQYEIGSDSKWIRMRDRPGAFWGLREDRVTDGQLLAFRVCRAIHERRFPRD
jgi:hypothetical protein